MLEHDFAAHGHLLVTLTPGPQEPLEPIRRPRYREVGRLADPRAGHASPSRTCCSSTGPPSG